MERARPDILRRGVPRSPDRRTDFPDHKSPLGSQNAPAFHRSADWTDGALKPWQVPLLQTRDRRSNPTSKLWHSRLLSWDLPHSLNWYCAYSTLGNLGSRFAAA